MHMSNVIPLTIHNGGLTRRPLRLAGAGGSASGTSNWDKDEGTARRTSRSRACVFILDDQFTGRKILQELVQSIDSTLKVETFESPQETLRAAAQQTPDLVLTDYKMPELDGVEFTRRLRAIRECADVPVVMITVVEDPEVRYRALDAGATDFLVRPIDQHECRARCRNLLYGSPRRDHTGTSQRAITCCGWRGSRV
jgi:two-component system response regulator RpfG